MKTYARIAAGSAAALIAASAIAAAPAMAEDYPPSPSGNNSSNNGGTVPDSDSGVAYTGSDATVIGLIAGLAAVGVGGGLIVASRRRKAQ